MADVISLFPEEPAQPAGNLAPAQPVNVPTLFPESDLKRTVGDGLALPENKAARVLKMQYSTGMPVGVIERNLDDVEKGLAEKSFDADKFRAENPKVAQWLAEDKNRAAIAKSDIGSLNFMERLFTSYSRGIGEVQVLNDMVDLQSKQLDGKTLTADEQAQLASLKSVAQRFQGDNKDQSIPDYMANKLGYSVRQLMSSAYAGAKGAAYGGVAGAATGSVVPGVGTIAGGTAGMIVGGAMSTFEYIRKMEAATSYDQFANMKDVEGKTIDPKIARASAHAVGIVNAAIEVGSDAAIMAMWGMLPGGSGAAVEAAAAKGALKQFVRTQMPKVLENPTVLGTVLKSAGKIIATGGIEGAEEFVQNLAQAGGEKAAKVASGQTFKEVMFGDIVKEGASQALDAFVGTTLMAGIGGGIPLARQVRQIHQAQRTQEFMAALGDTVENSDMHSKLPEATRDFIGQLKQSGPIENVYVDAAAWDAAFNGEGQKAATEVFGTPDQFIEARTLVGDLVIPVEVYAEKVAATPFHQVLMQDLRLKETDISIRNADQLQSNLDSLMQDQKTAAEARMKADEPGRQVYQQIYGQLTPMMGDSEAARNATLEAAKYVAAAEQIQGMDALTLYNQRPVTIKRDILATAAPEGLMAQGAKVTDTPEFYNAIVAGIKAGEREQSNLRKQQVATEAEIIRNNGMVPFDDLMKDPKYWDAEAESMTDAGKIEYQRREDAMALEAATAEHPVVAELSDLDRAHQFAQRDAMEAILNALGIDHSIPRTWSTSRYIEVTLPNGETAKIRFANHANQVQTTHMQADVNVAPGEATFSDVLMWLQKHFKSAIVLRQNGKGSIRGMFERGSNTITMLRTADPSTFQHEASHSYLENMRRWVRIDGASQQLKDDFAAISKYAGIPADLKDDQLIPTEAHEKWARSWEAYLMEGKSPSVELQGAFARMKDWLVRIYRTVLALDVELNPEIRAVMDRTVATADQIERAREMSGANEEVLAPDWMTSAERAVYEKLRTEARNEAETDIRTRLMSELVRERADWWKAEKAQVRAEVESEVNTQPVYAALQALQTGKLPDGRDVPGLPDGLKLSRDAIVAQYGEDYLKTLPKPFVFQMEGGLHPDVAAEMFGFKTGGELLNALQNAPNKKTVVDMETDARMMERHGDMMNDGSLAERAAEAVANDKQMAVYYRELQILLRQGAVGTLMPLSAINALAKSVISGKKIGELSPSYYESAAAKAGRDAVRALIGKEPNFTRKLNVAFEARQRQILNLALFKEAAAVKRTVDKTVRSWKMLNRADARLAKGRNMDLVNTARAILANFGVGASDRTPQSYMETMAQYDPQTYQDLKPIVDLVSAERKPLRQLTADEFSMVKDAVDGLWHMSRTANQMLIDGRRVDKEEVKSQLMMRMDEFGKPPVKRGYDRAVTDGEKRGMGLLGLRAAMRRVESWVDAMDGGDFNGAFRKFIWQPISDATTHYREMRKVTLEKYLALVRDIEKSITIDKIDAPELGYEFGHNGSGRAELLGAMLHTGNESNLYKLLVGRGWAEVRQDGSLNTAKWDGFIARMQAEGKLGKAEYDFLQNVWNLLGDLKPDAQRAHKEIYGYYFNEVTAKPFVTPRGAYAGGYYPAITDSWVVDEAGLREDQAALESQQNSFMFPTTGRGFTKGRSEGYAKPLMLDMRLVPNHIDKVLRFTFIEPRIKEVGRLMIDKQFRAAMESIDAAAIGDMLMPWLQRAATQVVETPATGRAGRQMDAFWRGLRSRTGAQIMVMNVTNTIQQFTGVALAATKVSPGHLASALWNYVRSPTQTGEDVAAKSEFMRNRITTAVFEIQKEIDDIMLNPTKYERARAFATKHGYFLQQSAQSMVDTVAWSGAYDEAVAGGADEKAAVRQADSAVRLTQGTFAAEDISRFETGSPLMRIFTMFYTYFNMQANLLGTEFSKATEKGGFAGAKQLFYIYTFGFMLPAVLSEAITQLMSGEAWKDKDKDDDWLIKRILNIFFMGQLRTGLAMGSFVGQLGIVGINQWNDKWYDDRMSTSPVMGLLEGVVRMPYSVYKAITKEQGYKRAIKDVLTSIGLVTGLPLAWLGRPLGYLADVEEGKEQPANALDMARGMISGRTEK